jgi:hypothetical protein
MIAGKVSTICGLGVLRHCVGYGRGISIAEH